MNKKIKALIAVTLWIALLFITIPVIASSVNNVTSEGVDGNLVFYDSSKNEIFTIDATNRRLSIPSGSSLYSTSTTVTLGGVTYTWPGADGSASQFIQTDGSGTLSWATGGATAYDDIADPDADSSITFQNNEILAMDFADTDEDMFTIQGLGAFGDVSVVKIEQKTGNATNGTVLEVVSADTDVDALVVNANSTEILNIGGSGTFAVNGAEFDVSGTTGAITINDGGDAGQISIEGSVLDINSLTFVGAGEIATAASTALTLNVDSGSVAGEDLIITAHNIQLTATGAITMSPDAAVTTAIDITDTDFTNALSVGDNAILGTTGIINYTNFDVDASGNLSAVDGTFSGNVNITGTFQQDSISAATAATTLTVDGTGVGGVTIGGTSTGAVTLGGGATQVTLPSTVDLVLSGGDITATDTANADMVTFTNNTMTTADLVTLSASGTRTSDNVIEIVDGATTASTIGITANAMTEGSAISVTANAQTSGYGFSYANSGAVLTGAAINLAVTDGAGFTGDYIRCYDGAAEDFTVERYGEVTIGGVAGADMITITAGNFQMTDGDIDVDDGFIAVNSDEDHASNITRNFDGAGASPVLTVADSHASSTNSALTISQVGSAGTALKIDQTGTGNAIGIDLNVSGDYPAIDIDAGAARDGDVIDILMTNMVDERALNVTGAWTGATGEGLIEVNTTAAATVPAGQVLRLDQNGTGQHAAAIDGSVIYVADAATAPGAGTSYAVTIDATNIEGLHVKTGLVQIDEGLTTTGTVTATGGLTVTEDIGVTLDAQDEEVTVTATDTDYAANAAVVNFKRSGAQDNASYILALDDNVDGDAQNNFLVCRDNSYTDVKFKVDSGGATTIAGALTAQEKIINAPLTFAFTTECDITATLTSSIVLLDGDNDADNDTIDLQNGTTAGQVLILIAAVEIDADDTCTINYGDTTATNAPATAFDKVGESATLVWTGSTWVVTSLSSSL